MNEETRAIYLTPEAEESASFLVTKTTLVLHRDEEGTYRGAFTFQHSDGSETSEALDKDLHDTAAVQEAVHRATTAHSADPRAVHIYTYFTENAYRSHTA